MLLFLVDLINIEIFRISFSLFYSFSFILCSRATSQTKMGSGCITHNSQGQMVMARVAPTTSSFFPREAEAISVNQALS